MTLGELAYASLREAILTTRLLPGASISENELSARIGVSRTPVREAIRRLVEDRLVEVTPQQGTIVSRIDAARARQAVFLRQTIEGAALKRKGRLSRDELTRLDAQVARHLRAIEGHDTVAAARMDDEFHALLMDVCGCPEATIATRAVSGDIERILYLSGIDEHYYPSVANDHLRLLKLLKGHRQADALNMLMRHIGGFAVDQDLLKQQSAEFFTD